MRFQGAFDLPRGKTHERHDRAFIARRTNRNGEPSFGAYQHKDHPNLRQNHRPEDKPRHGNPVAQVGRYGEEYLPSDIGATAMTEWEICELFWVTAPTVRAGIKALCKSGVLSIYGIKRIMGMYRLMCREDGYGVS